MTVLRKLREGHTTIKGSAGRRPDELELDETNATIVERVELWYGLPPWPKVLEPGERVHVSSLVDGGELVRVARGGQALAVLELERLQLDVGVRPPVKTRCDVWREQRADSSQPIAAAASGSARRSIDGPASASIANGRNGSSNGSRTTRPAAGERRRSRGSARRSPKRSRAGAPRKPSEAGTPTHDRTIAFLRGEEIELRFLGALKRDLLRRGHPLSGEQLLELDTTRATFRLRRDVADAIRGRI